MFTIASSILCDLKVSPYSDVAPGVDLQATTLRRRIHATQDLTYLARDVIHTLVSSSEVVLQ
jgi:hypothetical protein